MRYGLARELLIDGVCFPFGNDVEVLQLPSSSCCTAIRGRLAKQPRTIQPVVCWAVTRQGKLYRWISRTERILNELACERRDHTRIPAETISFPSRARIVVVPLGYFCRSTTRMRPRCHPSPEEYCSYYLQYRVPTTGLPKRA